nr:MAG TPA: hypothetical protein [Caudoviricetes sp.]
MLINYFLTVYSAGISSKFHSHLRSCEKQGYACLSHPEGPLASQLLGILCNSLQEVLELISIVSIPPTPQLLNLYINLF